MAIAFPPRGVFAPDQLGDTAHAFVTHATRELPAHVTVYGNVVLGRHTTRQGTARDHLVTFVDPARGITIVACSTSAPGAGETEALGRLALDHLVRLDEILTESERPVRGMPVRIAVLLPSTDGVTPVVRSSNVTPLHDVHDDHRAHEEGGDHIIRHLSMTSIPSAHPTRHAEHQPAADEPLAEIVGLHVLADAPRAPAELIDGLPSLRAVLLERTEVDIWERDVLIGEGSLIAAYRELWSHPAELEQPPSAMLLVDEQINRVHDRLIAKSVHGVTYLDARRLRDRRQTQRSVPSSLLRATTEIARHPECLVIGAPGTGKTSIAVELAISAAVRGDRVLIATYRRPLAAWLRRQIERLLVADRELQHALRVTNDPSGRIVVGAINQLSGARPADEEDLAGFFTQHAPEFVTPERMGGSFDVIIVDDWHALPPAYRPRLAALLRDDDGLYAFADPWQGDDLDALASDAFSTTKVLAVNHRTPRAIGELVQEVLQDPIPSAHRPGGEIELVPCASDELGWTVDDILDQMETEGIPEHKIAVLWLHESPHPQSVASLIECFENGRRVETTVSRMSGLERDIVILVLDVDHVESTLTIDRLRRRVALAASRAGQRLIVIGNPQSVRLHGLGELADRLSRRDPTPAA